VLETARDHVAEDLVVAVRMRAKSLSECTDVSIWKRRDERKSED
jgi:hypothetical protein